MNETETVLSKKLLEKIQKAKALVAEGKILRYQNEKGHIEEFRAFPSKSKNFNMEPYVVTPRSCSCIDWRVTHASEFNYRCKHVIGVRIKLGLPITEEEESEILP